MKNTYKNPEGYSDPTAYYTINNTVRAEHKIKITEAQEQERIFEWAAWHEKKYPGLELLHAIPNGGYRHKKTAKDLKRQGVKPGVSDIFLPVARQGYYGLYIELKAVGGRVSDLQADWINKVRVQGYYTIVAYGFDEAKNYIIWYLEEGI